MYSGGRRGLVLARWNEVGASACIAALPLHRPGRTARDAGAMITPSHWFDDEPVSSRARYRRGFGRSSIDTAGASEAVICLAMVVYVLGCERVDTWDTRSNRFPGSSIRP